MYVCVCVRCNVVLRPLSCVDVGHGTLLQIADWERDEELCNPGRFGGPAMIRSVVDLCSNRRTMLLMSLR